MKDQLIEHLKLLESKISVVPMAPPIDAYPNPTADDLLAVCRKFELPEVFCFYPANTWRHKNHIGLCDALSILHNKYGLFPKVICSGGNSSFSHEILRRIKKLGLMSQIRFIGFVSPLELVCLYKLSHCVIFPSKYEGWGLPVTEAMRLGVPVACSDLPVLKEQAGDASLFFAPGDSHAMADAIRRLLTEEDLRKSLSKKGIAQASRFSWDKTARIFRAHYRALARRDLTEEDKYLIHEASK
jgi:glycosyltransferase involved in cell wall biosynthesis